jgi:hypothetical protein
VAPTSAQLTAPLVKRKAKKINLQGTVLHKPSSTTLIIAKLVLPPTSLNPLGLATPHHSHYPQNQSSTQRPMTPSSPTHGRHHSARWRRTVRPSMVAAGASPAHTKGAVAAPRRTQPCGGPSLASPAGRRGCGAHCPHGTVVVAEGKSRGHLSK